MDTFTDMGAEDLNHAGLLCAVVPTTLSNIEKPDVRWTIVVEPDSAGGVREDACRRVWERAGGYGTKWGAGQVDTVAVRASGATLVIAGDADGRLAAALVEPTAIVSVIRYELREALRVRPRCSPRRSRRSPCGRSSARRSSCGPTTANGATTSPACASPMPSSSARSTR